MQDSGKIQTAWGRRDSTLNWGGKTNETLKKKTRGKKGGEGVAERDALLC